MTKMHLIPIYFTVIVKILSYFRRVNNNKVVIHCKVHLGAFYLTVHKHRLKEAYYKKIGMCLKQNLFKMILMLEMKDGMMLPICFMIKRAVLNTTLLNERIWEPP